MGCDVDHRRGRPAAAFVQYQRNLAGTQDVRRTVHGPLDGAGNANLPHHLLDSRILLPRQRPGAERPASDGFAYPVWLALLHIHAREDDAPQHRRHQRRPLHPVGLPAMTSPRRRSSSSRRRPKSRPSWTSMRWMVMLTVPNPRPSSGTTASGPASPTRASVGRVTMPPEASAGMRGGDASKMARSTRYPLGMLRTMRLKLSLTRSAEKPSRSNTSANASPRSSMAAMTVRSLSSAPARSSPVSMNSSTTSSSRLRKLS